MKPNPDAISAFGRSRVVLASLSLLVGCADTAEDASPPKTLAVSNHRDPEEIALRGVNHKHLKPLEWLIGKWRSDNSEPDGRRVVGVVSCQWALDGNFISITGSVTLDGKPYTKWRSMIGWDDSTKTIKNWGFVSLANGTRTVHREATWRRQGDAWIEETRVVHNDGKTENAKTVRKRDGRNAFTTETTVAGIGRITPHKWRRQK